MEEGREILVFSESGVYSVHLVCAESDTFAELKARVCALWELDANGVELCSDREERDVLPPGLPIGDFPELLILKLYARKHTRETHEK